MRTLQLFHYNAIQFPSPNVCFTAQLSRRRAQRPLGKFSGPNFHFVLAKIKIQSLQTKNEVQMKDWKIELLAGSLLKNYHIQIHSKFGDWSVKNCETSDLSLLARQQLSQPVSQMLAGAMRCLDQRQGTCNAQHSKQHELSVSASAAGSRTHTWRRGNTEQLR